MESAEQRNPKGFKIAIYVGIFLLVFSILDILISTNLGTPTEAWSSVVRFVLGTIWGLWSIIGAFVGRAASRKGRSFVAFFWLSFFFSPILLGLIVATLRPIANGSLDTLPSKPQTASLDDIAKLADLLERGLISQDEYDKKKADLLDKI